MAGFEDRPGMSADQFEALRTLIQAHCGLRFPEELKFVMERRLGPRLIALGLTDFGAYERFLHHAPGGREELEGAVELLLTHETYFYREPHQLEALVRELFPRLQAERAAVRELRLWSAGCSTGEEAYTLAMLLKDSGRFTGWDVEILATDLSRHALEKARRAEYGPGALRATPEDALGRHFTPLPDGRVRVDEALRRRVRFAQANLLDARLGQQLPSMDVILCRNVLIYFDPAARRRALQLFHDRLSAGGYLLLGHAEHLLHPSADFVPVQLQKDLVYQRREARRAKDPRSE